MHISLKSFTWITYIWSSRAAASICCVKPEKSRWWSLICLSATLVVSKWDWALMVKSLWLVMSAISPSAPIVWTTKSTKAAILASVAPLHTVVTLLNLHLSWLLCLCSVLTNEATKWTGNKAIAEVKEEEEPGNHVPIRSQLNNAQVWFIDVWRMFFLK